MPCDKHRSVCCVMLYCVDFETMPFENLGVIIMILSDRAAEFPRISRVRNSVVPQEVALNLLLRVKYVIGSTSDFK